MKLKALLLGSAAAMIAVSGARAADAPVAEPEPMEYVKVCDMYGSGFFYIPGTETCLSFNGYVRNEYEYSTDTNAAGDSAGSWVYRTRLNVDARNETDYGTLRSQMRLQADGNGGGDAAVGIDRALISLGGLRFGYSDSYNTTLHGYGLPVAIYDGNYDYDQAIFLDYTYSANGFSATVGLQDSIGGTAGAENPDPYAGMSYAGSWGRVAASVIYDTQASEAAYKVSASITAIENLTIKGWYQADDGGTNYVTNGDWEWGLGVAYTAGDFDIYAGYTDGDAASGAEYATVGLNWRVASGLRVQPEVRFFMDDSDQVDYRLRVVRNF